jgi:DNA-binding MarR family transcriptional regulator
MTTRRARARPGPFVGDYLLYLLAAASDGVSREFHAEVRRAGLRVPHWRVLACLSDVDGLMVTDLARLVLYQQSRLTKTVDGMERAGLVERRSDPSDRRRTRVFVTKKGLRVVAPLIEAAKTHEASVLSGLPADDARRLKPLLRRLVQRAEGDD